MLMLIFPSPYPNIESSCISICFHAFLIFIVNSFFSHLFPFILLRQLNKQKHKATSHTLVTQKEISALLRCTTEWIWCNMCSYMRLKATHWRYPSRARKQSFSSVTFNWNAYTTEKKMKWRKRNWISCVWRRENNLNSLTSFYFLLH